MNIDDHCFFLLDKKKYISSSKALDGLRKEYKRVGHSGTLDPYAHGLLVVGVNRALKFLQFLPEMKEYIFEITFGLSTASNDLDGEIIAKKECFVSKSMIECVLSGFIGKIMQKPNKFSALKINGQRAYSLARKNIDFELQDREVEIFSLELMDFSNNKASFIVQCSKGTYVRSLAGDICSSMNVIGCVSFLKRTQSDGFILKEDMERIDLNCIAALFPSIVLSEMDVVKLKNGIRLPFSYEIDDSILSIIDLKQTFLGLVRFKRGMLFCLSMV